MAADRLHGDAQPENHDTSLSAAAATLAYKSFHMTEHASKGPMDSSDAQMAQLSSDRDTQLTLNERARRPAQVDLRDRKVARGRAHCIGMSAGMIPIETVVKGRADSPRSDRPHLLHGRSDAKRHGYFLAAGMMSRGVET